VCSCESPEPPAGSPAQVLGYAGVIGTTAFGLVRAMSDAAEIIG
jgi:hypothetical protein